MAKKTISSPSPTSKMFGSKGKDSSKLFVPLVGKVFLKSSCSEALFSGLAILQVREISDKPKSSACRKSILRVSKISTGEVSVLISTLTEGGRSSCNLRARLPGALWENPNWSTI